MRWVCAEMGDLPWIYLGFMDLNGTILRESDEQLDIWVLSS